MIVVVDVVVFVNVCDVVADVVIFADVDVDVDVVVVDDAAAVVVVLAAVIFIVSKNKKFLYLVSIATNKQTTTYKDIYLILYLPIQLQLIHEEVYGKVNENPILEKGVKWVYNVRKGLLVVVYH